MGRYRDATSEEARLVHDISLNAAEKALASLFLACEVLPDHLATSAGYIAMAHLAAKYAVACEMDSDVAKITGEVFQAYLVSERKHYARLVLESVMKESRQ